MPEVVLCESGCTRWMQGTPHSLSDSLGWLWLGSWHREMLGQGL